MHAFDRCGTLRNHHAMGMYESAPVAASRMVASTC